MAEFKLKLRTDGIKEAFSNVNNVKKVVGQTNTLYKKGIKPIHEQIISTENILKNLVEEKKILNDSLITLKEGSNAYKNQIEKIAKINSKLDEQQNLLNDIKDRRNAVENIISETPLRRFIGLNNKFKKFNKSFDVLKSKGGVIQNISGFLESTTSNIGNFGKNIISLSSEMGTSFALIQPLIAALGAEFVALLPVIGPIIAAVAAIGVAVFAMKKIWDFNIGGIQNSVFEIVGVMKDMWGQAILGIKDTLQKLGPVLKVLFTLTKISLLPAILTIKLVFMAIKAIIDPIFDVLSEAFKPLADASGSGFKLRDVMKSVEPIFKVIAGTLGFITKIIVFPLRTMFAISNAVSKVEKKIFGWFFGLKPVQKIIKGIKDEFDRMTSTMKTIGDFFKNMFTGIKIPNWLQKVIDFFAGNSSTSESPGATAKETVSGVGFARETAFSTAKKSVNNSSSTNNNVMNSSPTITVNTSREISSQGAKDFANSMSGILANQSSVS